MYYKNWQYKYVPKHENNYNKRDINIGSNISNNNKIELLDYLYHKIDINNLKYSILKNVNDVDVLKENIFHVGFNFHGYNYILVITSLINTPISIYIISKLDLLSDKKEANINNIKIFKLDLNPNIDYSILNNYNNTIIDGKIIYKKNDKIFLINDIYYYKNNKLLSMKLLDKFILVDPDIPILNNFINNIFTYKIIQLYTYKDIEYLVYNKINNSDFKINGLIFLPIRTSKYYIYINESEFENIKNTSFDKYNNSNNIKLHSDIEFDDKELLLKKTNIVDVYDVFTTDKSIRFGIASIPNIELSHKLRKYFELNDELITNCTYDKKFMKWKPILS